MIFRFVKLYLYYVLICYQLNAHSSQSFVLQHRIQQFAHQAHLQMLYASSQEEEEVVGTGTEGAVGRENGSWGRGSSSVDDSSRGTSSIRGSGSIRSSASSSGSSSKTTTAKRGLSNLYGLSKLHPVELARTYITDKDLRETLSYIVSNPSEVDLSERQWTILLEMSLKNRDGGALSVLVFEEMYKRNLPCNSIHMTGLLSQLKDFDHSQKLFLRALELGMEPSVHNFSPLLKKSNSTERTKDLLQQMDQLRIAPNVITLTAAIKSCEPTGDWEFALDLLDLMRAIDIMPNEITYSCVISVASQGTAGNVALNILREMQNMGISVNMITYGSALVACARSNLWAEVHKLLSEMELAGIPIQESILISVINVCRDPKFYPSGHNSLNWKRAVECIDRWGAKVPDASESLFTIVMDVCEGAAQYPEVITTLKKMVSKNIKGTKSAFSFVIRACSKLMNAELAIEIINDYRRIGVSTAYMYEDVALLCTSLRCYEHSMHILNEALHDNHIDRQFSSRVSKKVVSRSLEYYAKDKSTNMNNTVDDTPSSGGDLSSNTNSSSDNSSNINCAMPVVENIVESFEDNIFEFLRLSILNKNLILTASGYRIASAFLLHRGKEGTELVGGLNAESLHWLNSSVTSKSLLGRYVDQQENQPRYSDRNIT